jgi:predicted dithiol-disulfide oxidoreductase (DUF899 family)
MRTHPVVSRAEWLVQRKTLLAKEKELTRLRDELSAARRALPWVKVEEAYVFDAPEGKRTLAELFDGRSQLAVYHFMLPPDVGPYLRRLRLPLGSRRRRPHGFRACGPLLRRGLARPARAHRGG